MIVAVVTVIENQFIFSPVSRDYQEGHESSRIHQHRRQSRHKSSSVKKHDYAFEGYDLEHEPNEGFVVTQTGEALVVIESGSCHRSLQNQPAGVESKPATLRCFIHITLLDPSKWHFHYLIFARCSSAPPESLLADLGPPFGGALGWMLFISAARSRLAKQSGISAGTRSAPASRRKATKARPNASVRSFRVEGPTQ
jgi:hypothetical protein